jgi:hypothetical protein
MGAVAVALTCFDDKSLGPIEWFIYIELVIVGSAFCSAFPPPRWYRALWRWLKSVLPIPQRSSTQPDLGIAKDDEAGSRKFLQRLLLLLVALEFVAYYFLIRNSGGVVHSPFAPLIVVYATFTPWIANRPFTTFAIFGVAAVFYAGMAVWVASSASRLGSASVWADYFVTMIVAVVGLVLAGLDHYGVGRD